MIGGEAEASWGWLKYGQWFKWAQQHGAAMFLLEHRSGQAADSEEFFLLNCLVYRFYGASAPTEDMSTENMVYLSSR